MQKKAALQCGAVVHRVAGAASRWRVGLLPPPFVLLQHGCVFGSGERVPRSPRVAALFVSKARSLG